jgi:hypothetical protein
LCDFLPWKSCFCSGLLQQRWSMFFRGWCNMAAFRASAG